MKLEVWVQTLSLALGYDLPPRILGLHLRNGSMRLHMKCLTYTELAHGGGSVTSDPDTGH